MCSRVLATFAAAVAVLSLTCRKQPEREALPPEDRPAAEARQLEVRMLPASGSGTSGTASFTSVENGVRVVVEITGAEPGEHGIHIHEKADCSAPDATSAGGHFNPTGQPHGLPAAPARHLGDLGNIVISEDGTGSLDRLVPGASLSRADPRSFLGRAIILHTGPDTGAQPTGDAGARIACGEILAPR